MNWTIFATLGLLIVSNIVMTFAWYGHLKLQQMGVTALTLHREIISR